MATDFVNAIVGLSDYHDKPITHTQITGNNDRFHGFRRFKFRRASNLLKRYQRNVVFKHAATAYLELETRVMTDTQSCTGVVSPASLETAPYNLKRASTPINGGAVSRHTYHWSLACTDTLLHMLVEHPNVLDVWVTKDTLSVFVIHDRNILGGLLQERLRQKSLGPCRGRAGKSRSSASSSGWPVARKASRTEASPTTT
jgi:hypothetical protein